MADEATMVAEALPALLAPMELPCWAAVCCGQLYLGVQEPQGCVCGKPIRKTLITSLEDTDRAVRALINPPEPVAP